MEWTGLNELRETFLEFFVSKGHTPCPRRRWCRRMRQQPSAHQFRHGPPQKILPRQKFLPNGSAPPAARSASVPRISKMRRQDRHATAPTLRCWATSPSAITSRRTLPLGLGIHHREAGAARRTLYISVYQDDDEAYDIWTKRCRMSPPTTWSVWAKRITSGRWLRSLRPLLRDLL